MTLTDYTLGAGVLVLLPSPVLENPFTHSSAYLPFTLTLRKCTAKKKKVLLAFLSNQINQKIKLKHIYLAESYSFH